MKMVAIQGGVFSKKQGGVFSKILGVVFSKIHGSVFRFGGAPGASERIAALGSHEVDLVMPLGTDRCLRQP